MIQIIGSLLMALFSATMFWATVSLGRPAPERKRREAGAGRAARYL
jgi:hypothetical protein